MFDIQWRSDLVLPQDPDAVLDYTLKFHRYLGDDTIASASVIASGCTADIRETEARSVTVRVSAVTGHASATIRINRSSGQIDDRTLQFNSQEF